jgi:hypothetical protein
MPSLREELKLAEGDCVCIPDEETLAIWSTP